MAESKAKVKLTEEEFFQRIADLPERDRQELRTKALTMLLEALFGLSDYIADDEEIGPFHTIREQVAEHVTTQALQALHILGVTKTEINAANERIEDSPLEMVVID